MYLRIPPDIAGWADELARLHQLILDQVHAPAKPKVDDEAMRIIEEAVR